MPGLTVRPFRTGDEDIFFKIVGDCFGPLEYVPRVKAEMSGRYFNLEGSLIAEKNGSAVGCVSIECQAIFRAENFSDLWTRPSKIQRSLRVARVRGQGVGSALMNGTIREAQRLLQKEMKVHTLALLDHLAPGAILYLRSGGRIEGEFLQLERKTMS